MASLPLIVGYGGINAAGRSIFDLGYNRILFEKIGLLEQQEVLASLGHLMGTSDQETIINKTLMREIIKIFFNSIILEILYCRLLQVGNFPQALIRRTHIMLDSILGVWP